MKLYKDAMSQRQQGFTLLELMVAVMIVGVLAAVALPSYNQYIRRAARADAQSSMMALAEQLARYRAKNLNYINFVPSYGYSDGSTARTIYVPIGSGLTDYKYKITLGDGTSRSLSLTSTAINGQSWFMLAEPNTSHRVIKSSEYMLFTSSGLKCKTTAALTTSSTDCGASTEAW